jgi:hypothetical protein
MDKKASELVELRGALLAFLRAHAAECPSEILGLYGGLGCDCPLCHAGRQALQPAITTVQLPIACSEDAGRSQVEPG